MSSADDKIVMVIARGYRRHKMMMGPRPEPDEPLLTIKARGDLGKARAILAAMRKAGFDVVISHERTLT